MPTRFLAASIVLIAIQSAVAEERSLVVARRSTGGAIVDAAAKAQPAPSKSGVVLAAATVTNVESQLQHKTREVERLKAEIKQLRIGLGANPQILVRVEMLEVSLTKLQKMGVNIQTDGEQSSSAFHLKGLQKAFRTTTTDLPYSEPPSSSASSPNSFINWLQQNRIAKALANPNIVVMSGHPGSIFVGGEFPIPSRDTSNPTVEFRKFGTELDVLAIAKDKDHVRVELRARVSEIDVSRTLEVNGSKVPGVTARECKTAVETTFGDSVILDGFVQNRRESIKTGEGKIKEQDNYIMMMVVITPELVEPITPPAAKLSHSPR